jgi:hypothetical protein
MRTLISRLSSFLSLWVFKPVLALVVARFIYAFVRWVFRFDPGPWLATSVLGLSSHDGIEIARWAVMGVPALILLAWREAQRAPVVVNVPASPARIAARPAARVAARAPAFDSPDSSIRYAFQFVHAAPFRSFQEKERVGKQLIETFASGRLRAWGREMVGTERLPLAEIPKEAWRKSRFTYWFLDEGQAGRDICHVQCDTPQSAGAPLLYTDLRVNREQLRAVLPGPALSRSGNEWRTRSDSNARPSDS